MMVIEGILNSQSYMDELLMSVVLPFAVPEPVVKDDNAKIHLLESANFTKTKMCALTGHCAHQTCLQLNMCRTLLDRMFNP